VVNLVPAVAIRVRAFGLGADARQVVGAVDAAVVAPEGAESQPLELARLVLADVARRGVAEVHVRVLGGQDALLAGLDRDVALLVVAEHEGAFADVADAEQVHVQFLYVWMWERPARGESERAVRVVARVVRRESGRGSGAGQGQVRLA